MTRMAAIPIAAAKPTTCVTRSSLRRSNLSASTPLSRPTKSIGAREKKPTSDTRNAESVSVSTIQPSSVICIHRESSELKFAGHKMR